MLKELMLSHPALRLAVAESLTGGRVQALVTAESGASAYFVGGVTAYTIDRKIALLGVDRAAAGACNGVSAGVARQMALGVCRLIECNLGVSTTGYAEPDPANGAPVPRAHWAVCHLREGGQPVFIDGCAEFPGLVRAAVQARVSEAVVGALAKYLTSLEPVA